MCLSVSERTLRDLYKMREFCISVRDCADIMTFISYCPISWKTLYLVLTYFRNYPTKTCVARCRARFMWLALCG